MITLEQKYKALLAHGYDCDTRDGEITAWRDDRPQPESWEEIIATAAVLPTVIREQARAAIAAKWAALPSWIRGPFGEKYESAIRRLDANDDDTAADLIRYADAPALYSPEQAEVFELVRAELLAALSALPTGSVD